VKVIWITVSMGNGLEGKLTMIRSNCKDVRDLLSDLPVFISYPAAESRDGVGVEDRPANTICVPVSLAARAKRKTNLDLQQLRKSSQPLS